MSKARYKKPVITYIKAITDILTDSLEYEEVDDWYE